MQRNMLRAGGNCPYCKAKELGVCKRAGGAWLSGSGGIFIAGAHPIVTYPVSTCQKPYSELQIL